MPFWRSHSDHARYVDMWMFPNLHPTNIDLLQRLKSADDRQFGTNMDIVGTVSEYVPKQRGWVVSHQIGLRTDIWHPDAQERSRSLARMRTLRRQQLQAEIRRSGRLTAAERTALEARLEVDSVTQMTIGDIEQRRLVLKHFRSTGTRIRWTGTIEELTSWEVANSLAANRPLLSLAVNLAGRDAFTIFQQHSRRVRYPAVYGFCHFDEQSRRMWNITVKRRWISLGADFDVLADGKRIGMIDGNLIGFGYNAYVDIQDPVLGKDGRLMDMLSMFASSVGYHRGIWKSLRRRMQSIRKGRHVEHIIDNEELRLLTAPRRRAA